MSGIRELLCVRMLGENEELVKELESEVNEHYHLICEEICKRAQFQRLIQNFKSNTDTSFSKLFIRAFSCAENNSEIYHAIRKIFFKTMHTCQQVVICLNSTVRAIETVTITLVSLYKYLCKNKQKAANHISTHIQEFQSQNTNILVSPDAVKESQELISFIEKTKSSNSEHEISDKLYKLLQPVKVMHFCLVELSNTNDYMDMYYNILFGDSSKEVDVDGDTTWNNSTTKKLFLKYFGSILSTKLLCTQFIKDIEKLRDNFQEMIHSLPIMS